jgi:hypothetical protein
MNAYTEFMARHIAEEIKSIEDPYLLAVYLRAIVYQRCRTGGAKEGTCKGCVYQCNYCRKLNEVATYELEAFEEEV